MNKFQLISDSGCDFTKEEVQSYNVTVIPFYITLDGNTHLKEGIDISKKDYFKLLKEDKNLFPKTAQPSPQDYIDVYTPHLQEGRDIISLTISSKLSGTFNSATLAAEMLKEDFPDRKIIVIDSLNVAVGQGLILKELAKMRDAGKTMEEAERIIKEVIASSKIYFTLDSLEYLKRGGRVGPTTALVGGILGLKPILHIVDGAVEQFESVRGKKRVLQLIEEGLVDTLKGEPDINISIGHIQCPEDAVQIRDRLELALETKITNPVTEVGVTVGTHAGPGALAIAYCKKSEAFGGNRK